MSDTIVLETGRSGDKIIQKINGDVITVLKVVQGENAINAALQDMGYAIPEQHKHLRQQLADAREALANVGITMIKNPYDAIQDTLWMNEGTKNGGCTAVEYIFSELDITDVDATPEAMIEALAKLNEKESGE